MNGTRIPAESSTARRFAAAAAVLAGIGIFVETAGVGAQQAPPTAAMCSVTGTINGLGGPLPGVSITVRQGETVQTATSTGVDGTFKLALPDASYQLTADLAGFDRVIKDVTVSKDACTQTVDVAMTLAPRTAAAQRTPSAPSGRGAGPSPGGRGANGADASAGDAADRRFDSLELTENAVTARLAASAFGAEADPSSVVPSGFGSDSLGDAIAVTGDAARIDRNALNDRRDAVNRGDFTLPQFDGRTADAGFSGLNFDSGNRGGGRGNNNNNSGNFQLGGRGGRQNRLSMQATYGFSGSALSAAPRQFNSEARRSQPQSANHNYSFQLQGPARIPGIFLNPNNSTQVSFQMSGSVGTSLFDQTATVPTYEMRAGDFSSVSAPLIDPTTGLQFEGNRIPLDRISPQAIALMDFYPAPNLPGTTRNYRFATTVPRVQNQFQFRVQHNFSGQAANSNGRGGGGNNNNRASNAGQAGQGRRLLGTRTNVNMNLPISFSNNENDTLNVFTKLGGTSKSTSLGLPLTFNIQRGRVQQQIGISYNYSSSQSSNNFTGVRNISQEIGINGVSDNPFAWGLPRLSFSSISGLSDVTPTDNTSHRANLTYSYRRPFGTAHQVRIGGDYRYDLTTTNNESIANGSFVYTGLYTSGGGQLGGLRNFDFADFLLGMPQQATLSYGPGATTLDGRILGLYVQDDWRALPSLTMQLGVRYDIWWPFIEQHGQLVNLDVNSDFTGAVPVQSGETGEFTGEFPKALIETDYNNVSPKFGVAWRAPASFVVRGSWEINYNAGSYSSIARRLAQQPPFATTGVNIGDLNHALRMENALSGISPTDTRNNYGIDKGYIPGVVQQAAVNVQRQIGRTWQASAEYVTSSGRDLEIVRAPNRDDDGLSIEGVQPFTWISSEGISRLHSGTFRLEKQASRGISYGAQYTIARSMDNSPSISGGGGAASSNVAQDERNIEAEWGISNFDQRHRLTLNASAELPFGPDRKWLYNGGFWAGLLDGWQVSANFTANSGRPYSIIVRGAANDIASGLNGALRADYDGSPTTIDNPGIDKWFNTDAFSVPNPGSFGSSPRNIVFGPGSRMLNANISRAVQMGGNRSVNIQVSLNNILDLASLGGIDTNVNSPTFGQVTSYSGSPRSANLRLNFRF